LLGLSRGEKKITSGFLFLDPEDKFWGPSGTLAKEQGSPELISDYGAQRALLLGLGALGP